MVAQVNVNPLVQALDVACTSRGIPFGDSNRPDDAVIDSPYVVVHTDGGRLTDKSLLSRDGVTVSIVFHTYAWSPDGARAGRRKVIDALFSVVGSVVGGWIVNVPVHQEALPIEREDQVNPPLYWQTDSFTVRLSPA